MTLNELKVNLAIGSLTEELRAELFFTDDVEILKYLVNHPNEILRRIVAVNKNTPYSLIKFLYTEDSSLFIRQLAWERIVERFKRRFSIYPPRTPESI